MSKLWFTQLNSLLHMDLKQISQHLRKVPETVYIIQEGIEQARFDITKIKNDFQKNPKQLEEELIKYPYDEKQINSLDTQFKQIQKYVKNFWEEEDREYKQDENKQCSQNGKDEQNEEVDENYYKRKIKEMLDYNLKMNYEEFSKNAQAKQQEQQQSSKKDPEQ